MSGRPTRVGIMSPQEVCTKGLAAMLSEHPHRSQDLRVITKDERGGVETRSVLPVVFVPLVRDGD